MANANKEQGSLVELKFMSICAEMGIGVSLPFGDNQKYDCITDRKGLNRVQIKSTSRFETSNNLDAYNAMVSHGAKAKYKYTSEHCDIIAIYVIPHDAWYIIPISNIFTKTIKLYPHKKTENKYERWRDRFDLL